MGNARQPPWDFSASHVKVFRAFDRTFGPDDDQEEECQSDIIQTFHMPYIHSVQSPLILSFVVFQLFEPRIYVMLVQCAGLGLFIPPFQFSHTDDISFNVLDSKNGR